MDIAVATHSVYRFTIHFEADTTPLRSGIYIVPTNRWYIERTVWLIAGGVLLASTALALWVNPLFVVFVIATGMTSIVTALTGFCVVGNALIRLGFTPMIGNSAPKESGLYFMPTDRWYLERRIYLAVGVNISVASVLSLVFSPWWAGVHRLRRRSDGVVRRHWVLHHGERPVLTGRRAAARSRAEHSSHGEHRAADRRYS